MENCSDTVSNILKKITFHVSNPQLSTSLVLRAEKWAQKRPYHPTHDMISDLSLQLRAGAELDVYKLRALVRLAERFKF